MFSFLRTTGNGTEVELPIFPRERLKLVTFLGSGAFGEVFEGLATDIHGNGTGDTRVAVKVGKSFSFPLTKQQEEKSWP